MKARDSLGEALRRQFEWGSTGQMPRRHMPWFRIGPLMIEVCSWWFRLGVVVGKPCYLGVYAGPFAVTIGKRFFLPRVEPWTWTVTTGTSASVQPSRLGE